MHWKECIVVESIDLAYLGIAEASELFRKRELSPVELVNALYERDGPLQNTYVPYITQTTELALKEARAAEDALLRGDSSSPLLGIPVAYKDIVMTKGIRTTCGSAVHEQWVPDIDAAVVESWRAAGAVMMGKLNTHEFAFGIQGPSHLFKPALNPWNPKHVPGGSSSGSGVALAAGLVLGAIGTDTGGSIRNPAAYCGITGLKPTYGRVSRYGVVTRSWSLDHVGPMARSAEDVAILLGAIAGYDPRDPASAQASVPDYTATLKRGIGGFTIAVPQNYFFEGISDDALAAFNAAVTVFKELGATIQDVTISNADLARCISVIRESECYAYHAADFAEIPEKYGPPFRTQVLSGGIYFASEYVQAQRARSILRDSFREALGNCNLMLTPSQLGDAPLYEEMVSPEYRRPEGYTGAFNMTGMPSMAIPAGFSSKDLPLSVMLSGRPFDEASVLAAGYAFQKATTWHKRHPNL
jgi:aspartyl-tRNA(Asn)/glutamyl-tRNA(Gln) amidotransferase subunit A